jgi:N-acetylglutamate synthase-like GNAT family acetyltransferase
MDIRLAREADFAVLHDLARRLHGAQAAPVTPVRQASRIFVASQGEPVIGFAIVTLTDFGLEKSGAIEALAVSEDHQGGGHGAALIDQCERWLAEEGIEVVFVSALVEAAAFYRRIGFQPCTGPWLFHVLRPQAAEPPPKT